MELEQVIIEQKRKVFTKETSLTLLKQAMINNRVNHIDWAKLLVRINCSFSIEFNSGPSIKLEIYNSPSFCIHKIIQKKEITSVAKRLFGMFEYLDYNAYTHVIRLVYNGSKCINEIKLSC